MKTKWMSILLSMLLLFSLICFSSCKKSPPPALEDIYDDAVDLIERSYAINDILFGYGLPVWEWESSYAEIMRVYQTRPMYEAVTPYATVTTTARIKTLLSSVYSSSYVESLSSTLFDGYAYEEGAMSAQLKEDSNGLHQNRNYQELVTWQRIYDYSTMRVVDGDAQTAVIAVESYLENDMTRLTVELVLVLENGVWRLDTPTY